MEDPTVNQPGPYIEAKVHVGVQEDREPRKRPRMFFFDRIKLLLVIAVILTIPRVLRLDRPDNEPTIER